MCVCVCVYIFICLSTGLCIMTFISKLTTWTFDIFCIIRSQFSYRRGLKCYLLPFQLTWEPNSICFVPIKDTTNIFTHEILTSLLLFQAYPLYLGLPCSTLPCLLWLLLLQCDAAGPSLSAHILGIPHSPHDQEIYDWLCKSIRKELSINNSKTHMIIKYFLGSAL